MRINHFSQQEIEAGDEAENTLETEFVIETGVRKAIRDVEMLVSASASGLAGPRQTVDSLLDLLTHLRVTLGHVLSAKELVQSKKRVEDLLRSQLEQAVQQKETETQIAT